MSESLGTHSQSGPGQQHENGNVSQGQLLSLNTGSDSHSNAILSPSTEGLTSGMSPISAGGTVRRSAPEPNKRALYVGGLDQRVTEEVLRQIFETAGTVQNVKIIPDKNFQSQGHNYGFVEYEDMASAERAMQTLNGRSIHQNEIRVNWAYQSQNSGGVKEDTTNHFHIFVGDLSNEVNDEILLQAFSAFGNVSEARVMWDMKTGRSRGYGFVAFRDNNEAEKALAAMNGEWLGSRQIRCNWANQKGKASMADTLIPPPTGAGTMPNGMTAASVFSQQQWPTQGGLNYNNVVSQTPHWQTTVYIGNLTPYTSQNDILPFFQMFGYIVETRFNSDRGFAFVKMDTHEHAAAAICQINGYNINGRPLKCSWGKDRPVGSIDGTFSAPGAPIQGAAAPPNFPPVAQPGFAQSPPAYFPQYAGPSQPMSPHATSQANFAQSPIGYAPQYGNGGFGRGSHQGAPQGPYQGGQPPSFPGAHSTGFQQPPGGYQGGQPNYQQSANYHQPPQSTQGAYSGNFNAHNY